MSMKSPPNVKSPPDVKSPSILSGAIRFGFLQFIFLNGSASGLIRGTEDINSIGSLTKEQQPNELKDVRRQLQEDRYPTFDGDWEGIPNYPQDVGEGQGVLIGDYLVSTGGFYPNFATGPLETFGLDLSKDYPDLSDEHWNQFDNMPLIPRGPKRRFLTHGAHATKGGNQMYICGGYLGIHPGPHVAECYEFAINSDGTGTWSSDIPDLPDGGRAGGGMLYIEQTDSLLFTMGAVRPEISSDITIDTNNTWALDLKNITAGWQPKSSSPYRGNHVSAITAYGCASNIPRYFVLGGQVGEDEKLGNIDLVYEYRPSSDKFVQRTSMPKPRGHFTTSIAAYGCGFITVGGAVNGDGISNTWSDEIWYFDIDDKEWIFMGTYPALIKTSIVGVYGDYLWSTNGYTVDGYKRKLVFPKARFILWNADKDKVIGELGSGSVVKFCESNTDKQFNIEFVPVRHEYTKEVRFMLLNKTGNKTFVDVADNSSRYFLQPEVVSDPDDILPVTELRAENKKYMISAKPNNGKQVSVTFRVKQKSC